MELTVSYGEAPLDLDAILKPVSDASPCGEPLIYEGAYDRIRELRRQDDELERGIWTAPLKKADWPAVERTCLESLQRRSKDLYLAAWLLEAWIHRYGFTGLRCGLQVFSALCRQFGLALYPRGEGEGDLDTLLAPVEWIDGKLPQTLKLIPITRPEADDEPRCHWADYEAGETRFQRSAALTGDPFFRELAAEVQGSLDECAKFAAVLGEVYGTGAPALTQLTAVLKPLAAYLANTLHAREAAADMQTRESAPEPVPEPAKPAAAGTGRILSRAEAYRRLAEAAEFLAGTEPHSPVPYLVRRAVFWGGLPLDELLPELLPRQSDVSEVYRLLQMGAGKPSPVGSKES
jgi:type VI secretion system protein ImpA